jgi:ProP effector
LNERGDNRASSATPPHAMLEDSPTPDHTEVPATPAAGTSTGETAGAEPTPAESPSADGAHDQAAAPAMAGEPIPAEPTPAEPGTPVAEAAAAAASAPELSPAECAARLAELFPAVFTHQAPRPLKLRIQADLQQRAPGIFTRKVLSAFLHRHTTSTAYLKSLVSAAHRFDLDGAPAGEVAPEHRDAAISELQRRRGLHEARRATEREVQRAAERTVHQEARRAQLAQDEQRRDLQALLRAFETSTLTKGNFCALKGLTETELDARLVLARSLPPGPPVAPPHGRANAPWQAQPHSAPQAMPHTHRQAPRPAAPQAPRGPNAPRKRS